MEPHILFHEGYLKKSPPEGKMHQRWHKRYFRLYSDKKLEYYKQKEETKPLREPIDLSECIQVSPTPEQFLRQYGKDYTHVFYLSTTTRQYHLVAKTESEMLLWQEKLGQLLGFQGARSIEDITGIITVRLPTSGRSTSSSPGREKRQSRLDRKAKNSRLNTSSNSMPSISNKSIDDSVISTPDRSESTNMQPDDSESSLSNTSLEASEYGEGGPQGGNASRLMPDLPGVDVRQQTESEPSPPPRKSASGNGIKPPRTLPETEKVSSARADASQPREEIYVAMTSPPSATSRPAMCQVICDGHGWRTSVATVSSNVAVIMKPGSTGCASNFDSSTYVPAADLRKSLPDVSSPRVNPQVDSSTSTVSTAVCSRVPPKPFDGSPHALTPSQYRQVVPGSAGSGHLLQTKSHPNPHYSGRHQPVTVNYNDFPEIEAPVTPRRDLKPCPRVDRRKKPQKAENFLHKASTLSYKGNERKNIHNMETVDSNVVGLCQAMDEGVLRSRTGLRPHSVPVPRPRPNFTADASVQTMPSQEFTVEPCGISASLSYRRDMPVDPDKELALGCVAYPRLPAKPKLGSRNGDYPCEYPTPVPSTDHGELKFYANVPAPVLKSDCDGPALVERGARPAPTRTLPKTAGNVG